MGIKLTQVETNEDGTPKLTATNKLIGIMSKYFTNLATRHSKGRKKNIRTASGKLIEIDDADSLSEDLDSHGNIIPGRESRSGHK